MAERSGRQIACVRCNGSGIAEYANSYRPWHEECSDCGGSGSNWRYPRGAIARYYSGPLIGKEPNSRERFIKLS